MKIKVIGSGQEVGRSGIVIENGEKIVLDYGVKLQPEPPQYLEERADVCIISHGHLDHVGSAPNLFRDRSPGIYMTDVTRDISQMLLLDSIKVSKKTGYDAPFNRQDLENMVKNTRCVKYGEVFRAGNFTCKLFDSGHIPGSASIFLENRKSVFYTGDIQTYESNLLNPAQLPNKTDVLITESTYGLSDHIDREREEKRFIEHVEEALSLSEVVLMPVFAVGRSQEILLILEKYADKIAIDGMVKSASDIISKYGGYLKDPDKMKNILRKVKFIHTPKQRAVALKKYPIIISSAGMLGGGPAIHYLKEIHKRPESKVLFTGFLVEESPGRNLIETKVFHTAEERFHVHCQLEQFNLSAHTDRSGLFDIIKHTNPELVICVHGDDCEKFAQDIQKIGVDAVAPENEEEIGV